MRLITLLGAGSAAGIISPWRPRCSLQCVVEPGDLPAAAFLRQDHRETGAVFSGERTAGSVQHRAHVQERDVRAQQASALDCEADGAAGVDGAEDCGMTCANRGAPPEMLTTNGDEIGVTGEGGSKGGSVHTVPGSFELIDNPLETGLVLWGKVGRHSCLPLYMDLVLCRLTDPPGAPRTATSSSSASVVRSSCARSNCSSCAGPSRLSSALPTARWRSPAPGSSPSRRDLTCPA